MANSEKANKYCSDKQSNMFGFMQSCKPGCKQNGNTCIVDDTVDQTCKNTTFDDNGGNYRVFKQKCTGVCSPKMDKQNNIACRHIAYSPSFNTQNAGGSKAPMVKTSDRVKIGKVVRIVYQGKRGGKYVKMNGVFVPLKKVVK